MDSLRLYFRFVATSLRAQMLYPQAFLLGLAGSFASTIIGFIGIWALFARFHQIRGWNLADVAVFYALVNIAFSIADVGTRGFDVFGSQFVRTGNFDRVLLRPRTAALQVLGYQVRIAMFGRLLQGLIILGIALALSKAAWGVPQLLLILWTISGGVCLFAGLLILQATMCFWTVESLEIANTLTYGGVEAAQYPLNIYARWFRRFLTFIVPIGCVSYFPIAALLGRADSTGVPVWIAELTPAAGFAFLALALVAWGRGIGRYTSAGG
jgi:ABC-2 type transport system permease protein